MVLVRMATAQGAHEEYGQDEGEDNHLFEGTGPESAKRFHDAHEQRPHQRTGVTGQTTNHRCHKTFQTNQKS